MQLFSIKYQTVSCAIGEIKTFSQIKQVINFKFLSKLGENGSEIRKKF